MKNSVTDPTKQHFSNQELELTALELLLYVTHVHLHFLKKCLLSIFLQLNLTHFY